MCNALRATSLNDVSKSMVVGWGECEPSMWNLMCEKSNEWCLQLSGQCGLRVGGGQGAEPVVVAGRGAGGNRGGCHCSGCEVSRGLTEAVWVRSCEVGLADVRGSCG